MSEQAISPDLEFVKEIIKNGGDTLKKCFQCATCSVVCNVTPDDKPFPRKEMIHAQWGLKDRLLSNPDIWLCHQCSDCTAYCPRGAKPGEVMNAIRRISIRSYASIQPLANMLSDSKYLFLLFALPVIIFLAIIASLGNLSGVPRGLNGEIVYSRFVPVPYIDIVFSSAAIFALVSIVFGIRRYWSAMSAGTGPRGNLFGSIRESLVEILAHKRFKKCDVTKGRGTSHFLVFYAFIGLAITTTWAMIYLYGNEWFGIKSLFGLSWGESPYPLTDPLKILGNTSALALLIGIFLIIINRMKNREKAGIGNYYDWLFISVIFVIMATGLLSELTRLANIAVLAYPIYFIHLVFVFFLFAYAPFSKMAHMFYRAAAMVFARLYARQ